MRHYEPPQESDQKDALIAQLKAELLELLQREKDFEIGQDDIRRLEQRFRLLQDDMVTSPPNLTAATVN